jgi:hypothetical protein
MKVTRDVILDLWPVYEAGEASADTRSLVEQFLADDPEFARLVRGEDGNRALGPAEASLPPDHEMETLRRTQRLVRDRQSALVLAAIFFMLSAYLRYLRPWILCVSGLCVLWWLGLLFFGRRFYRL